MRVTHFAIFSIAFLHFISPAHGEPSPAMWQHEAFSLQLFQVASQQTEGNFVISPYSAATAFGVAASGARGKTAQEMDKALGMSAKIPARLLQTLGESQRELWASTNQQVRLELSNSLWPERHFRLDGQFVNEAMRSLGATVRPIPMDSTGQKIINDAVSEATHGRIPVTLSMPPNAATKLILINTIYFNGKWMYPFRKTAVKKQTFFSPQGKLRVPYLIQTQTFPLLEGDRFSLLRLPYADAAFEMVLLLPSKRIPLREIERELTVEGLRSALESASMERTNIKIPKFDFDVTIPLNEPMRKLGMGLAFTPDADFSGITQDKSQKLHISESFQKANVTVDEEGTVASAVTAIAVMTAMRPTSEPPRQFHANRPFLFLIRHHATGQILFLGRVTEPNFPVPEEKNND